jgi:hypothetical protein
MRWASVRALGDVGQLLVKVASAMWSGCGSTESSGAAFFESSR